MICIGLAFLRLYVGQDSIVDILGLTAGNEGFVWETLRERVPLAGYLIGILYLNYLCLRRDLSLIPTLGLASCGYLMTELGWMNWVRFSIWLAIGLAIYFSYGRHHSYLHRRE